MSSLNKALARAASSVEVRVVLEQLCFDNKVKQLYSFTGDKYVPYRWETVAHHRGARHVTRLVAEVENTNLYSRLGSGYKKIDAFALTRQRGGKGKPIFSIRS